MKTPAERGGELATIDHLFTVLDAPRRPLDFTLVFRLADAPPVESLRAGARSARNVYPVTASRVVRRRWARFDDPADCLATAAASTDEEAAAAIEDFADAPFDPREHAPVRQLLVTNRAGAGTKLVTRFHHAAADGLSAALWLGHQLRVAVGEEPPAREASPFEPLPLRTHASPVRRSRFAYAGPSDPLLSPGSRPSRTRRWLTVEIAAAELRAACRRAGGFTYNDLLATCALETFARWNRAHGAGRDQRVGLWLPVNVRRRPSAGFGNGTSRVRLYARYAGAATFADKCREVRRQLSWCVERGEWAVPESPPLARLPRWAAAPLLHAYLGSRRVDMATGIFSHAEGWARGGGGEVFRRVDGIECVGQLHARHCAGLYGATHAGRTWLTFTYDPGLLSRDDARRLAATYEEQIDAARRELA